MKRTEAREEAFKLLYSLQFMKEEKIEEQIELYVNQNEITDQEAIKYINDIITGTNKENENLEKMISENIKTEWDINRISK